MHYFDYICDYFSELAGFIKFVFHICLLTTVIRKLEKNSTRAHLSVIRHVIDNTHI